MSNPRVRVLVVDDDSFIRESAAAALESEGYEVVQARNGAEALVELQQLPLPAVILLDLTMPMIDGLTFLRMKSWHHAAADVPTVVLTARRAELPTGLPTVARILRKPCQLSELLDAVREAAALRKP